MSRHTVDDLQAIADAIVAMAEPGEQIEANVARSRENAQPLPQSVSQGRP